MTKVKEIEQAIQALTPREVEELFAWLDRTYQLLTDARIESDANAGRLDAAIESAMDDEKHGRVRPL